MSLLDDFIKGLGTFATNIGDDLVNNASQVAMGASGLGLVTKAYKDLGDIGERAFTGVDPIAASGLQQTSFRPFTVTTGTGSSFGAGIPAPGSFPQMTQQDRIQQLMDSQGITREQAIANQQSVLMRGFDINNDGSVSNQEFTAARNAGLTGFPSTGLLTSGTGTGTGATDSAAAPQNTSSVVREETTPTPFGNFTIGYDANGNAVTVNGNPIPTQGTTQGTTQDTTQGTTQDTTGGNAAALMGGIGPMINPNLQLMLSPTEEGITTSGFTGAKSLLDDVTTDRATRELGVYNRIRATQEAEEERQRLTLEERLANQGRLGVRTAMFGGTPEQFALAQAQEEAKNRASLMAIQQAQAEQAQQAQLGTQLLGAAYIPQAQALNMFQQGLATSELAQRGQLAGASMFGEAKMSGLEALLGSGLGQANLIGAAGTGLLGGALG